MDYILIFFFFIILLVLVIFGLPIGRTSFNDEIKNIQNEIVRENFESKAPSTFYEWRDMTNNKFIPDIISSENETIHSEYIYSDSNTNYLETEVVKLSGDCSKCNAPTCKNIDKYVLKSSVPPCPDMNNYILKSEIPPFPDMNNYILKSEIPPFPDMNNYIRKNEIPSCPTCPNMYDYIPKNQIPVCPTCPNMNDYILKTKISVCEKCPTCPKEYNNITENPKFKEWLEEYEKLIEDKINNYYISKKECNKSVKHAYKNGEIDTFKEIARRFHDPNFIDFIKKKLGQHGQVISEVKEENRDQNNRVFRKKSKDKKQYNQSLEEERSFSSINNQSLKEKQNSSSINDNNSINQTSYNTTNMNNIYKKWNTNFDNSYKGEVKNNNYSNFADWNKSSLLLEEEYYNNIPNACNSF